MVSELGTLFSQIHVTQENIESNRLKDQLNRMYDLIKKALDRISEVSNTQPAAEGSSPKVCN
jgi:hypothetical protein